jgi:hypothetical protein
MSRNVSVAWVGDMILSFPLQWNGFPCYMCLQRNDGCHKECTQFSDGSVYEHISLVVWLQQLRYDTPLVSAGVNLLVLNRRSWNVTAHALKPDFVFRRKGRVHLNQRWRQFSRLLASEVCASAVVMLDTPCSEVVWRILATHSIRQFPLHFTTLASPCAITFQLETIMCTPT